MVWRVSVTGIELIVDRQVPEPMKKLVTPLQFAYLKAAQVGEVHFLFLLSR